MLLKERYLVVIAIISGRNFPERPDYHLICEARFNNEVLSTDPMPHKVQPQFEQELAWELDKPSLRQHRLQRSALKVQLFAVDNRSPVKEPVGYFMLDLRSCSFRKDFQWYRLLHSRYKNNPAVFCGLYLDNDGEEMMPDSKVKTGLAMSLSAADLIPRSVTPTVLPGLDHASGLVETKSSPSCYAIGPKCLAKERFQLTLQFHSVTSLASLIPLERELSTEGPAGFYFACELLGSACSSRRFDNLAQNTFHADEHTVQIKSTVSILRAYFAQSTPLTVNLCYGSCSLAQALVPIDKLLRFNDRVLNEPTVLEGKYELRPLDPEEGSTSGMRVPHEDDRPYVVLSLTLSRADKQAADAVARRPASSPQESVRFSVPVTVGSSSAATPPRISTPVCLASVAECSHSEGRASYHVESDDTSDMESEANGDHMDVQEAIGADDVVIQQDEPAILSESIRVPPPRPESVPASVVQNSPDKSDELHRFCYTIELRTLKNFLSLDHEPLVYARYVYPVFGSAAPVMTLPPVRIARYQEVTLSKGFCVFEFAASLSELRERLLAAPLVVELFDRSQGPKGMDEILGRATIQLTSIFSCPIHEAADGKSTVRRFSGVTDFIPAKSWTELTRNNPGTSTGHSVGQLTYGLMLEDHGVHVLDPADRQLKTPSPMNVVAEIPRRRSASSPPARSPLRRVTDVRATPEYQTALELELWRAAEEAKFTARLKEREQRLMATLAEEWHKRDSQRELICRKKISEYQQLEEKLRTTLADLTQRERQIAAAETDLARLRQETAHEAELRKKEVEQLTRIQLRDMESKVKLEAKQCEYWKTQADEWKAKYASLEQELSSIRSRLTQAEIRKAIEIHPPTDRGSSADAAPSCGSGHQMELARLMAELATVRGSLTETERRLDEAQRGRQRYRQLWTRTLHEVARLKQEAELTARQTLAKREAELEQLRLRYLAMGEGDPATRGSGSRSNVPSHNRELADDDPLRVIRDQLERFAEQTTGCNGLDPIQAIKPASPTNNDPELVRLIEERDGLLSTGVYEPDDPIIANLERQIRLLLGHA